jgi:hypothetical protein
MLSNIVLRCSCNSSNIRPRISHTDAILAGSVFAVLFESHLSPKKIHNMSLEIFLIHAIIEGFAGVIIWLGTNTYFPSILLIKKSHHHKAILDIVAFLMISISVAPAVCYYKQEGSVSVGLGCATYHGLLAISSVIKVVKGESGYGPDPDFVKIPAVVALVLHSALLAGFLKYLVM